MADALQLFSPKRGAEFSECGRYRYRLWREWSDGPALTFVMLNPSTADAYNNDPTVERCQRRATVLGCGRLDVVNLFALRSTDPQWLYAAEDPRGDPENLHAITCACVEADRVICAWGVHGALRNRGGEVLRVLRTLGVQPHALAVNADGSPGHPLYLPYTAKPFPI